MKRTNAFIPLEKVIRKLRSLTGFTLVELIAAVAIIVILAAIALPNYTKAKERGLGKEALANLALIASAEKIYKVEQGPYIRCSCTTSSNCEDAVSGCNPLLKLDLNPQNWGYTVQIVGGRIQASADRQGSGGYLNCEYRVDENGTLIFTHPSCP